MVLFQGCRGKEFSSLPLRPFVKPLFADIGGLVVGTVRYGGTPSGTPPVPHKTPGNIGLARRYGPVRLKSRRRGGKGKPSSPAFVAHFVELPSVFRPLTSVLTKCLPQR